MSDLLISGYFMVLLLTYSNGFGYGEIPLLNNYYNFATGLITLHITMCLVKLFKLEGFIYVQGLSSRSNIINKSL